MSVNTMISKSIILLSILSLVASLPEWRGEDTYQGTGERRYRGPPAPLNPDGTVAFTPETIKIAAAHKALFADEMQRIQAARGQADGHNSAEYSSQNNVLYNSQEDDGQYKPQLYDKEQYISHNNNDGQYRPRNDIEGQYSTQQYYHDDGQYKPHHHKVRQYSSQQYDDGQYKPHQNEQGHYTPKQSDDGQYKSFHHIGQNYNSHNDNDGQYKPHHHKEGQYISQNYDDGQYKPHHHKKEQYSSQQYDDGLYKPQQLKESQYYKNKATHTPATLNADGTVAHTPEYKAIASSFLTAYNQALTRHRRSSERYQGPPAPLNNDLTVDFTPEIKHAHAAHKAAISNHHQKLKDAASLAAAHPDLTSPPSSKPHDNGQYKPHLHDSGIKNADARLPIRLNPDGTVAQTPEYHAIATSLQAAFQKELSRNH